MSKILSCANTNQDNTKGLVPHLFDFQSHKVRVVTDEQGNPWFVAKDVCEVLNIQNPADTVKGFDDDERRYRNFLDHLGRTQKMLAINESGLYRLIFRSTKEKAKSFQKWVTSEVLPSIRKTGGYRVPETLFNKMADLLGETTHALKAVHAKNKSLRQKSKKWLQKPLSTTSIGKPEGNTVSKPQPRF